MHIYIYAQEAKVVLDIRYEEEEAKVVLDIGCEGWESSFRHKVRRRRS